MLILKNCLEQLAVHTCVPPLSRPQDLTCVNLNTEHVMKWRLNLWVSGSCLGCFHEDSSHPFGPGCACPTHLDKPEYWHSWFSQPLPLHDPTCLLSVMAIRTTQEMHLGRSILKANFSTGIFWIRLDLAGCPIVVLAIRQPTRCFSRHDSGSALVVVMVSSQKIWTSSAMNWLNFYYTREGVLPKSHRMSTFEVNFAQLSSGWLLDIINM